MLPCSQTVRRFSLFALICLVVSLVPPGATVARPVSPVATQPSAEFAPDSGPAVTAAPASTDGVVVPIAEATTSQLDLTQLPLSFVPNVGQSDQEVQFQAQGSGGTLFFTPDEIVVSLPHTTAAEPELEPALARASDQVDLQTDLQQSEALPSTVVRLQFDGANTTPQVRGIDQLPGVVNYFIGDDPDQWHTNIATYAGIVYEDLYPGIDLRYEGTDGLVKGTYMVGPDVDPSQIQWSYDGAKDAQVDGTTGDLVIDLPDPPVASRARQDSDQEHTLVEQAPIAWQEIDGQRVPVDVAYDLADDDRISFVLGDYDPAQPLIIDPTLEYSTYLGGSQSDRGNGIAVDADGAIYVAGSTTSVDLPPAASPNNPPEQGDLAGNLDAFIIKLAPDGDTIVYRTYLGGVNVDDASGIAIDTVGNAYIVGSTRSSPFPGASDYGGDTDGFVAAVSPDGSELLYSRYLGGSNYDNGNDIAVDDTGNAYITGTTESPGVFGGTCGTDGNCNGSSIFPVRDAFLVKLAAESGSILYSQYLGGSSADFGAGIAIDSEGNAYITGGTFSDDFPEAIGYGGNFDTFVVSVSDADGSTLRYSRYLGGELSDQGNAIAVDAAGNAYVTGNTREGFPLVNALQLEYGGEADDSGEFTPIGDAFVVKLAANSGDTVYSTYLGGNDDDSGNSIAVDAMGTVYVTGSTLSTNFPPFLPFDDTLDGDEDAFVAVIAPDGTQLEFSTYLGGNNTDFGSSIALDTTGNIYVTGTTSSSDLVPGETPSSGVDAFVAKIRTTEQPPIDIRITDTAGNDVSELALNDDGWPALNADGGVVANPVTVEVTVTCSEDEPTDCDDPFVVNMLSDDAQARFYPSVNSFPDDNELCRTLADEEDSSFTAYSATCESLVLAPGSAQTYEWSLWVQPSNDAQLDMTAEYGPSADDDAFLTIPRASITPIVFLPGLGATIPPENGSDPDANLNIANEVANYNAFYRALEQMGYEKDRTYFRFPYDWLTSTITAAAYLAGKENDEAGRRNSLPEWAEIAKDVPWVAGSGDSGAIQFDFVGHSTGNLVTRSYVQGPHWETDNVRRWVSVAGPLQGVPRSYRAFEGLEPDLGRLEQGIPFIVAGVDAWVSQRAKKAGYHTRVRRASRLTPEGEYAFVHDPINGLTILPEFLPTYGVSLISDRGGSPEPYGRMANTLYEDERVLSGTQAERRAAALQVQQGEDMTAMAGKVFDPYMDNPRVYDSEFRRKPLPPDFETTYYGFNTPEKMALLEARIGAENTCVVFGGADLEEDLEDDISLDTTNAFVVEEPQREVPYWFNGSRRGDRPGLGDQLIPRDSANLAGIWSQELPARNVFEVERAALRQSVHSTIVGDGITISAVTQCLTELQVPFLSETFSRPDPGASSSAQTSALPAPAVATAQEQPVQTSAADTAPVLLFYAPGPVELLLTDDQGRRLGYDPATATILEEIPGAVYARDEGEPAAYLFVTRAAPGSYTITVSGSGTGDYEVLGLYDDENAVVTLLYEEGSATSGQTVIIDTDVPATTAEVPNPPDVRAGPDITTDITWPVTFRGDFSDINATDTHTITWDFGDGYTSTGTLTPSHSYAAGTYTATLTVADSAGFVISDTVRVDATARDIPMTLSYESTAYAAGDQPHNVVVADLDGDTILDLVVTNRSGDSNVSILLGNGDGSFQSPIAYTLSALPNAVQLGDLNADGTDDLIVAVSLDSINVLLGNGDGSFQAAQAYPPDNSRSAWSVAVGDLNGDNHLDVATGSNTGGVGVFFGNGDGTLQAPTYHRVTHDAIDLALGDLDADGMLDIAVADMDTRIGTSGVSVLRNQGTGTFQDAVFYAADLGISSLALGDITGDTRLDVIVAHTGANSLGIFPGNGDGTFQNLTRYEDVPLMEIPFVSVVADMSNDGRLDVVVVNIEGVSAAHVLCSRADGTLYVCDIISTEDVQPAINAQAIASGDFNRDGRPDLVIAYADNIRVLLNTRIGYVP